MKHNHTIAFFLAFLLLPFVSHLRAGQAGGVPNFVDNAAEREIARRENDLIQAEHELSQGSAALKQNDISSAYAHYKTAIDLVPDGASSGSLRRRAVEGFSSCSVLYAKHLVNQGERLRAQDVARLVLQPEYNPDYRPAIVFLGQLEEADYYNKTITPDFAAKRDEVGSLLNQAVGFYDAGRFDMAQKYYQKVLALDKDNAAAFRGLEQVELAKQRYYESTYNQTRARMLWQVERTWERPKTKFTDYESVAVYEDEISEARATSLTVEKLNNIMLKRVSFSDALVPDAIQQLREDVKNESGDDITILIGPSDYRTKRVTLNASNLPFYKALEYVAMLADLKLMVEQNAIRLVALDAPTETMRSREFIVPPGFIPAPGSDSAQPQPGYSDKLDATSQLASRQDAQQYLENQGLIFPTGARAKYSAGSGILSVTHYPSTLDLIQEMVRAAKTLTPQQIEVETKFVEITQNNLKELGFDWTVGPFSIGGSGVYGGGGTDANATRTFPFTYPTTGTAVGTTTATGGLRTGQGRLPYSALSENSLNSLLLQNLGLGTSGGPAPGVFSVAGIFTNPQFQVLIRALNQKKGVDLMAAPKVTTKSGHEATIEIVRKFPYPTEFEPPQIPQNSGGNVINDGAAAAVSSDPIVTPAFPSSITYTNLGVVLNVTPVIGTDGQSIEMELKPEITDFEGFVNYGSPIFAPVTTGIFNTNGLIPVRVGGITTRRLLTENVINQPIFSKRSVYTKVSISDGETVAIGGLISEDVQKVNDKVPVLGDIPLAGALFRSDVERKVKRNLIIFTTARLIDANGQPLKPETDSDQEEIVEPLGLPPEIKPPRANPKSGITRK